MANDTPLLRFGGKGLRRSMAGFYEAFLQLSDTDRFSLASDQMGDLATSGNLAIDTSQRSRFALSGGFITLPANRVFRLTCCVNASVSASTGRIGWQFRNETSGLLIGNAALSTIDATILTTPVTTAEAIVDTISGAVDVSVEWVNNFQVTKVTANSTYVIVQQAGLSVLPPE